MIPLTKSLARWRLAPSALTAWERCELFLWAVFVGSLIVGLFGYGFFTLRPENLARWPALAGWHARGMIWGAQLQSVVCILIVLMRAQRAWGGTLALRLFVILSLIGFVAEWVGTSTGLPFGSYHYTDMLGYKIDGLVPWVIPPSWFAMGIPCYVLAQRIVGAARDVSLWRAGFVRVFIGAWLLMSWDLVLDPAMSHLLPYWQWHEAGFFYASPFINFVGWFLVGLIIMAVLEGVHRREPVAPLPGPWALRVYGLTVSMSAGMCVLAGEGLPLVVLAVSLAAGCGVAWFAARGAELGVFGARRAAAEDHLV